MLQVSGNKLQTSSGCSILLKGVDVDGLEFSSTGTNGSWPGTLLSVAQEAVTGWDSNFIRLPMNQDYWFGCGDTDTNGSNYRSIVNGIVTWCANNNVYVLLDLHWSGESSAATSPCGTGWGTAATTKQQPMADANAVTFWSSVAGVYAGNSAVLFDLYNEPYDSGKDTSPTVDTNGYDIWLNGGTLTGASFSTPGMQALLNAVRGAGANNVCLMGGLHWCANLNGLPAASVTNTGNGVAFAAHLYGNNDGTSSTSWNAEVPSSLLSSYPVFVGEYGPSTSCNTDNTTFDANIFPWLTGTSGIAGGTAWSMTNSSCPNLYTGSFAPTAWGAAVSTFLATPVPTCPSAGSPVPTNSPTFTFTGTPTHTMTLTATNTPTNTRTNSPTVTVTNTSTRTVTVTPTYSATGTGTNTTTPTATWSPTSTATKTPTATPTTTLANTASNTPTSTSTFTSTNTATRTLTLTPTSTATFTATNTATNTGTRTATATVTNSQTATPTYTLANTLTNTVTSTETNSPTNTTTRTATATATNSPTTTPTNTLTNTLTNTATPTATRTTTSTATGTTTSTTTNTATNTPTNTATPTATNTATFTITDTPTLSPTGTLSPSLTPTPSFTTTKTETNTATSTTTDTGTNTATGSPTATTTNTSTDTATASATRTAASTSTASPTWTATETVTNSLTYTPSNTATPTFTNTLANTATETPTSTATNSATRTVTSTVTNTLVNTGTPTNTPTPSPTPVTVEVSQGSSPPGNSSQLPGASGVSLEQIVMTNPGISPVNLTSLTLTETGATTSGITSVTLLKNGVSVSTASFTGSNAVFNFSDTIPASNGAVTYQVQANFSNTAVGNYSFSITNETGNNGQPVLFNPTTLNGATITVVMVTATPSSTISSTPTLGPASTYTPTAILTPLPGYTPVLFPNPSSGGPVSVLPPPYVGNQDVKIQLFTTAFRKVKETTYQSVSYGPLKFELTDDWKHFLASGLYYVVIEVGTQRSVVKLLLLH